MLAAGSVGAGTVEAAAAGSGVLRGAVDAVSGAVVAAGDVCARASTLLGLLHEHLMPEGTKVPEVLDSRVSAFGPNGGRLEELIRENVVSGLATSFVVLLGHGIPIEDSLVDSVPRYTKEQSARATELARRLQLVVEAEDFLSEDEE